MRMLNSILVGLAAATLATASPLGAQDAQAKLWDAAAAGDTVAIVEALDAGAKIDSLDTRRSRNGRFALNWAALGNSAAAVRLLLARGAPIEGQNLTGFTALHHAAEAGALDAGKALIAAGAKLDTPSRAGALPVETARERGHEQAATLIEQAAAERAKR